MRNLTIGRRLGLAFGLVLLITVLIAGIGMVRLGVLKAASHDLATVQGASPEMRPASLAARPST